MRTLSAAVTLAAVIFPLAVSGMAADMPANHPAVAGVSPADLQFFESRIRPILADHIPGAPPPKHYADLDF